MPVSERKHTLDEGGLVALGDVLDAVHNDRAMCVVAWLHFVCAWSATPSGVSLATGWPPVTWDWS
jgi:hypothetical protein